MFLELILCYSLWMNLRLSFMPLSNEATAAFNQPPIIIYNP